MAKAKAITKAMEAFAKRIEAPKGFTKELLRNKLAVHGQPVEVFGDKECAGMLSVVVRGEAKVVVFNLNMEDVYKAGKKRGTAVSCGGHTIFKNSRGGWSSFDRVGVSDSFYISHYDEGDDADVNKVLARELARIDKYLADDATRISVPVIGYRITTEQKAQYIATLKAGRTISFRPSGFGTGYVFSIRKPRGWGRQADPRIAEFFEQPVLWVEHLDCD